MKLAPVLLAFGLFASAPARADTIAGLGFSLGPEDVDVAVRGSAPLRHPRVATSPGLVRLWFAGNEEYVHLDQRGDGQTIRKLRVRPGADASHLLQITLGDERRLDPAAVRVEVAGTMAHIRIARAALPGPAPVPEPVTPPAAPAAAQAPPAPAAEAPRAAPASTADAAPTTGTTPRVGAATDDPEVEPAAPAARPEVAPRLAPATRANGEDTPPVGTPRGARRAAPLPARRGPGIVVYALLTLGLAGALLVLRLVRRNRAGTADRPSIEVVATRRLGPRHQLVVVRAFGRDHLLSVNGGTTQRIASVKSPAAERSPALPRVPEAAGGLFSKPWIDRSLSSEADDETGASSLQPLPRARRAAGDGHEPAFGAELLELAPAMRQRAAAPARTDSVSGLLRLRQQAGK